MTKTSPAMLGTISEGEVVQTELTLDEFLAHNPEEPPDLEYEGKGRVRRKISPTTDHAAIAGWLSYLFHAYRERTARQLFVYVELRINMGGLSRVPNVARCTSAVGRARTSASRRWSWPTRRSRSSRQARPASSRKPSARGTSVRVAGSRC